MDYIFGPSGLDVVKGRKLQVRVGSSLETLEVTRVNSDEDPHFIDSPYFTGFLVVRVKNFEGITPDDDGTNTSEEYFNGKKRLFALQLSGRFKHNHTADDIVFGSQFEKKCTPPYGSSIAMKFASLIDPAIQTDIHSDSPWIFSPILCSMNVVNVVKANSPIIDAAPTVQRPKPRPSDDKKRHDKEKHDKEKSDSTSVLPKVGSTDAGEEVGGKAKKKDKKGNHPFTSSGLGSDADVLSSSNPATIMMSSPDPAFTPDPASSISSPLSRVPPGKFQARLEMLDKWKWRGGSKELEEDTSLLQKGYKTTEKLEWAHDSWADRRKFFQKQRFRQELVFSPDHIYNFEIYAPFINLSTFDLSLGINVNILQYLNNQPLRMMAKSLSLNKYLFVIEFDLVGDDSSPGSKEVLNSHSSSLCRK